MGLIQRLITSSCCRFEQHKRCASACGWVLAACLKLEWYQKNGPLSETHILRVPVHLDSHVPKYLVSLWSWLLQCTGFVCLNETLEYFTTYNGTCCMCLCRDTDSELTFIEWTDGTPDVLANVFQILQWKGKVAYVRATKNWLGAGTWHYSWCFLTKWGAIGAHEKPAPFSSSMLYLETTI